MLSTKAKIKLAGISSKVIRTLRALSGKSNHGVFFRKGIKWELDLTDGIDFSIFLQGVFEPETYHTYKKLIQPGFTILDIGANIGAHTIHFSKLTGENGKVIAFEPTDYAFKKLCKNASLNSEFSSNLTLIQALLIDEINDNIPESIPSRWPLSSVDSSNAHPIHLGVFESLTHAKKLRLDDWYLELQKPKVNLIKIDVDGFEIDVLKGAKHLLNEQKPILVMEFAPYVFKERGYSFEILIDLLKTHQYNCSLPNGKSIALDNSLLQLIPAGGSINVVLK